MNTPTLTKTILFTLLAVFSFGLGPNLDARIGESREQIERRLQAAGGITYRDAEMREARMREMPYQRILPHLPGSVEVRVYFKTADGRRPMASELRGDGMPSGWDLHVIYVNNRSVLEAYRRSGALTNQEINELLALQSGNSNWERVRDDDDSALNFRMQRADKQLRALQHQNHTLVIFDTNMDRRVNQIILDELEESAPVSVEGF